MVKSPSRVEDPGRRRRLVRWAGLAAFLGTVLLIVQVVRWVAPSTERLIQQSRLAVERGEWLKARALAEAAVERSPQSTSARIFAAQAASAMGDFQSCLSHLKAIEDDDSEQAVAARCLAGDILLLHFKRLTAAEKQYRRALEQAPTRLDAHDHLAFGLGLANRVWEQVPHRLRVIRSGQFEPLHLQSLALGGRAVENDDLAMEYHESDPDDAAPRLMLARKAMDAQNYGAAETQLREALAIAPKLVEGHVKLGRVLLQSEQLEEMANWQERLPDGADTHPGIWTLRGEWARRLGDLEGAARCYWEAVRLNPEHDIAVYQLGRALVALKREADAQPFLDRAERLQQYVNNVTSAMELGTSSTMRKAAESAEDLGLAFEALGWRQLALRGSQAGASEEQKCAELALMVRDAKLSRSNDESNPALRLDLSRLALPTHAAPIEAGGFRVAGTPAIGFEDQSQAKRLVFHYYNGGQPGTSIARMQEFTGGGVAILDYDGDLRPDVYCTQGTDWKPTAREPSEGERFDHLFRNSVSGTFEDVTSRARLAAGGFGQGATIGDFNSDGFPDVFVANIGANQCFRNNGDGTFSDVTEQLQIEGNEWSTSCALADLNGDGLPDLYVVNYLEGDNVFTQECRTQSGRRGACFPQAFSAAKDRVYMNRGDGTFQEASESAGIANPNGKGLGIVACGLNTAEAVGEMEAMEMGTAEVKIKPGRPLELGLFVANDTEANSLFVNQSEPGGELRFADEAVIRGVAMNDQGKLEACMGVAAGDVDQDGRLDLLVTNFYDESNTLYRQIEGGLFEDSTTRSALQEPTLKQLGFGVQFVDANLDGWQDVVVANGHIADYRDEGTPYRMPPQAFYNQEGRFHELSADAAGDYFRQKYLGRAVARLDWNKDGADDLIVGHLDRPIALLTNVTRGRGNYLALHLRGVESARDAIGAVVRLVASDHAIVQQLTAGDGFQASNERRLVFGLGSNERIERLDVKWPSGQVQTFTDIASNREIVLIEGLESPREFPE